MQFATRVDEALAGIVVAAMQVTIHADGRTEFQGLRLAVQKPVRPPFAGIAFLTDAPDLAADPAFLFQQDRKSTRLNSSHIQKSRMPSSA